MPKFEQCKIFYEINEYSYMKYGSKQITHEIDIHLSNACANEQVVDILDSILKNRP